MTPPPHKPVEALSKEEENQWLERALSEGMPIRRIAEVFGKSPTTISTWIKKRPNLMVARLKYELDVWAEIREDSNWRAKAWILTRISPGDYNEIEALVKALREAAKKEGLTIEELAAKVDASQRKGSEKRAGGSSETDGRPA